MKEMGNLDEVRVWKMCFPKMFNWSCLHGVYVIPRPGLLKQHMEAGERPSEADSDELILRLELAIDVLWPQLQELFEVDFFPSLLACATDLLRAADFGENSADPLFKAQVQELAQALDAVEKGLDEKYKDASIADSHDKN